MQVTAVWLLILNLPVCLTVRVQASFHKPELASLDHQVLMPQVPAPESLPTSEQRLEAMLADPALSPNLRHMLKARVGQVSPIDVRSVLDASNWASPTGGLNYKQQMQVAGSELSTDLQLSLLCRGWACLVRSCGSPFP